MDFEFSARSAKLQAELLAYRDSHVSPAEELYESQLAASGDPHSQPPVMEELKAAARARALWNLFLPGRAWGAGLTNTDYAPLAEIMGRSAIASEALNCSAPDTGNMELLVLFGTEAQQREWLGPLRGHGEVQAPDVRVAEANLLGAEGGGFAMAQARLGPGRVHHAMRAIGMAERALQLMCRRVTSRVAFGAPL